MNNLVEHASLSVLEAALKKKRKLMGVSDPVMKEKPQLPVQTHEIWDIKRKAIGLTDRQCLKSAKFDRLVLADNILFTITISLQESIFYTSLF